MCVAKGLLLLIITVLPDGLDQLRLKEVLCEVIMTTVNIVDVRREGSAVGSSIPGAPRSLVATTTTTTTT